MTAAFRPVDAERIEEYVLRPPLPEAVGRERELLAKEFFGRFGSAVVDAWRLEPSAHGGRYLVRLDSGGLHLVEPKA